MYRALMNFVLVYYRTYILSSRSHVQIHTRRMHVGNCQPVGMVKHSNTWIFINSPGRSPGHKSGDKTWKTPCSAIPPSTSLVDVVGGNVTVGKLSDVPAGACNFQQTESPDRAARSYAGECKDEV